MRKSKLGIVVGALLCALSALPAKAEWRLLGMEVQNGVNSVSPYNAFPPNGGDKFTQPQAFTATLPPQPAPPYLTPQYSIARGATAALYEMQNGTALAYTAGIRLSDGTPAPAVVVGVFKWVPLVGEPATSVAGKSLSVTAKTAIEIFMAAPTGNPRWGMVHPLVGDVLQSPLLVRSRTYPYGALCEKASLESTMTIPLLPGLTEQRIPFNIGAWAESAKVGNVSSSVSIYFNAIVTS